MKGLVTILETMIVSWVRLYVSENSTKTLSGVPNYESKQKIIFWKKNPESKENM